MATKLDQEARKARIRERLKQAEEPKGKTEATAEAMTDDSEEATTGYGPTTIGGGRIGLPHAATSQRSNKPANYKLHVLTALSLAVVIRVVRYGTKALTG